MRELEAALAPVTEEEARSRPFPGKWTIGEVADHIAQTQIRAAEELRHLVAGRRPPGPPVYEALRSGAPAWAPWTELADGVRSANQEVLAVLDAISESNVPEGAAARSILVISRPNADNGATAQIFSAELNWKEYALVQRLHLLEHRNQVKKLREALHAKTNQ